MFDLSLELAISSFIAGILMFLAPCTLPLVPAYLVFIAGVREYDTDAGSATGHYHIVRNAIFFTLGFSVIFVIFGLLASYFASTVGPVRDIISRIGGVLIIFFGLVLLNVISIRVLRTNFNIALPRKIHPGSPLSALTIGGTFALGWTPCVGPILASILLLAGTSETILSGTLLLVFFSLGISLPFIISAILYDKAVQIIPKMAKVSQFSTYVGGVFLIGLGFLLVLGEFTLLLEYGYKLFGWLGIEGLYKFF